MDFKLSSIKTGMQFHYYAVKINWDECRDTKKITPTKKINRKCTRNWFQKLQRHRGLNQSNT